MVVDDRSEYFAKCRLRFGYKHISWGLQRTDNARGQRRKYRVLHTDRKATVTEITTSYNQGMQTRIYECTTHH